MKTLRVILGDQLSETLSSLKDCDFSKDIIFFHEGKEEFTHVKHHKKKIAFLMAARRHFAAELKKKDAKVCYQSLEEKGHPSNLTDAVQKACQQNRIQQIVITKPSEYYKAEEVASWSKMFKVPVKILDDNRFLCTEEDFKLWAKGRKQLTMEYFYREMRKKYNILMEGNQPLGGKWNYDAENRKPPDRQVTIPSPYKKKPDATTQSVLEIVSAEFSTHFGDLEPFYMAVTRKAALQAFDQFVQERLPLFGTYQDAMLEGEPWMFHSHISFYINCGLLDPHQCIQRVEQAFHDGHAPLNAVEGFIRQILGWREYVRGIYWLKMPAYAKENCLQAKRKLPEFFWSAKTKMNCLKQCIEETKEHAYAHHIQRLMVLGNFALLAGIHPDEVNEWYWIVYADAYEWVELPNVSGMILYADGGLLASKPYAASGAYINKMSNYCRNCAYKVTEKNGKSACPFNYLYWDFLRRNESKLGKNLRLARVYSMLHKMTEKKIKDVRSDAARFFKDLEQNKEV
ncbi:cryptochrome/photolyase family protein [Simkania sp.]|uniref:cryptochrome/photolyase family protein n=1 Tax=Simkania sp. TaxID=34094 RepID=UPI003B51FB6A